MVVRVVALSLLFYNKKAIEKYQEWEVGQSQSGEMDFNSHQLSNSEKK